MDTITIDDFQRVDIRVGRIVSVEDFSKARRPSYRLTVDFGPELGRRRSAAQLTEDYSPEQLLDQYCLAVVNLPPRNIAGFSSEVLLLAVPRQGDGTLSLVRPVDPAVLGGRLY